MTKQNRNAYNVHNVLEFPFWCQKKPGGKQEGGITDLPVPVVRLDVVGKSLGLDVGRVVVTVVMVV